MSFVRYLQAVRSLKVTRRLKAATRQGWHLGAVLLICLGARAVAERPPVPALRIPLEQLGFPGYPVALLHAGASMATVHLLDRTHVLFTFSLRSLVRRLPDEGESDTGRMVAGEIVELPSGKVLARTEWRLRDHGRYLWSAGQGLFVLRSGRELSVFAPLRGLEHGKAFERIALPHRSGTPELIESSPDGKILTVQLQHPEEERNETAEGDEQSRRKRTTIEFYRLSESEPEKSEPEKGQPEKREPEKRPSERGQPDHLVQVQHAGVIGAPGFLRLSVDGDGYLWAEEQRHNAWAVSFNEYEGKPQSLAQVDSTCAPTLRLLSRSEFATLSCGAGDGSRLASFGFDGHLNWDEPLDATLQAPTFATAPLAGRFALSRVYADSTAAAAAAPLGGVGEEIRVYGNESGDLLLRVNCAPVERTAENFDLSADGRTLAVLGSKSLDLYTLPELNAHDLKAMAEVEGMRPPEAHGPVVLRRITRPIHEGSNETEETVHEEGESAIPDAVQPAEVVAGGGSAAGSGQTVGSSEGSPSRQRSDALDPRAEPAAADAPRKPPTLLNPGESPQFKPPGGAPQ